MVQQVNGFKLDKSHTFAVNLFDDVSRYMQVPDEYEAPEDKEFEEPVSLSTFCFLCGVALFLAAMYPPARDKLSCVTSVDTAGKRMLSPDSICIARAWVTCGATECSALSSSGVHSGCAA